MHASNDVIMTTATNPEVLAICYAQGWCASADKMTKSEAEAVTDIAQVFRASNIVHFDEFKYFTSVTSIGAQAFYYCTSLTSIIFPSSVTTMGYNVMQNCTNLTSAVLPSGLTSVLDSTFYSCSSLVSVDLPSGLTNISSNMFRGCASLALTELPSGVTSIGNYAFWQCSALALTALPSGVTAINNGVFVNAGITELTIPSGVTSIGAQAFYYANDVAVLTCLATTAPSVDASTFTGCGRYAATRTLRVPSGASGYDQGYWLDLQTRANYPFTIEYI